MNFLEKRFAVFLVGMDEDLDVRTGSEPVTARGERVLDLAEVVDLAIGDDLHRTVLVGERLLAAGNVDDREAAHGKADARQQNAAFVVGTPMVQGPDHSLHVDLGHRPSEIPLDDPDNPAHGVCNRPYDRRPERSHTMRTIARCTR